MRRCQIYLAGLASLLVVGEAFAAAVEEPAGALLPPAIAGADTVPAAPELSAPAPSALAAPARATPPGVSFGRAGEALAIVVRMAGAAATKLSQSPGEVLLSFPRALPSFDAQALLREASGLLTGLSVGFDTMLLQLAPGASVARSGDESTVRLLIRAGAAPALAPDTGEQRLQLLRAQLAARTGDPAGARRQLDALRQQMPDSPDVRASLASVDQQGGRWRMALGEYEDALRLDPGNPGIEDAIAAIRREQGPRLRTDFEYRQTDGGIGAGRASALIEGLSGFQNFGDGWRVGFSADLAQPQASQFQLLNGRVGRFSGNRGRTEIYVQHDTLGGDVAAVSLYGNGETLGAGAHGELRDPSGTTLLRGEYHRPDWDFLESLINQGTRDRVSLGRQQRLLQDLTGRLEIAVNRYNVPGHADVNRTVTVTGEVRLADLAGVRGLSVAYVLDAEYLFRRSQFLASGGTFFSPLGLVDREVHAVTLSYAGSLGRLTYEGTAGYGADRYGKSGPLVGAVLGYSVGNLEARARASYVQDIGRSRGTTQIYGGALSWIF